MAEFNNKSFNNKNYSKTPAGSGAAKQGKDSAYTAKQARDNTNTARQANSSANAARSAGKQNAGKKRDVKKTLAVVIFVLLALYYGYLRLQEGQSIIDVSALTGGSTTALSGSTDAGSASAGAANGQATSAAQQSKIEYTLAGNSGKKEYDANGNLIDTSDFLTSVTSAAQVLPKGFSLSAVPPYCGVPVIEVNGNVPFFTDAEKELASHGHFEYYGELDSLGRCTVAFDCLGKATMPASGQKRGSISEIKPTGWKQARYDCIDSETVMTRAHLAGYMVSAENANKNNLITGTRYMNSWSMLPYEEGTQDFLWNHKSMHVLYRVTPCFRGNNLMADGILMEAMSVEDHGASHQYCIFVYNVQPGLQFNYATGSSVYSGIFFDTDADVVVTDGLNLKRYGYDASTGMIHTTKCGDYAALPSAGKCEFYGDTAMKSSWASMGYSLCKCMK